MRDVLQTVWPHCFVSDFVCPLTLFFFFVICTIGFSARHNTVKRLYTYYVPYDAFHGKLAEQGVDQVEKFMQVRADQSFSYRIGIFFKIVILDVYRLEVLSKLHKTEIDCWRHCS